MATWEHLRQQSNVTLGKIELVGSKGSRRVSLDVTVDGVAGAALGVMSQGELHSLALSLFLPRATLAESPFRFVVIDDPVQSMDPARIDGTPILTVSDWQRHAPPKLPHHWVEGRSAYELAYAWCGLSEPAMPDALQLLLDSREITRGFVPELALPEHRIPFDSFGGEPRNADLALTGSAAIGRVAITIEAKADEPFGETVAATLAAAIERRIEKPESNGVKRVDALARALFRPKEKGQPRVGDLRYQLLTAAAGTLAFADAQAVSIAVLIVHEFATKDTKDANHIQNGVDYNEFLLRLAEQPLPAVSVPYLHGPFAIPGGELFPGGRSLYIGKVTTNRRK
jgi:hypothetical protein